MTGIRLGSALVAVGVLSGPGCGDRHSRVRQVLIWEGDARCSSCASVTLWPNPPSRVSLRPDSTYTVRLDLETSGDSDRCVYKFVSGSWELPQLPRFDCAFEDEVMYWPLDTRRVSPPPHRLSLRVETYSRSEMVKAESLLQQQYEVEWIQ